jgi:hypothetical protein
MRIIPTEIDKDAEAPGLPGPPPTLARSQSRGRVLAQEGLPCASKQGNCHEFHAAIPRGQGKTSRHDLEIDRLIAEVPTEIISQQEAFARGENIATWAEFLAALDDDDVPAANGRWRLPIFS